MKHILFIMSVLLFSLPLSAQKLTVESMTFLPDDATARLFENQREDGNGTVAGIVKVIIALDGVVFDGASLMHQEKRGMGEYWVWMADRATRLTVRTPNYQPLEINFRDYDFQMVHSKNTYKLVITVPTAGVQPQDDGMSYLVVKVEPMNAQVDIDGTNKKQSENGEVTFLLSRGSHTYSVTANNYAPQEGTVTIGNEKKTIEVKLVSTMAQLKVECPTTGAQVYVNDKLQGTVPWNGSVGADTYRVEVRKDGHRSQTKTLTLSENATQTVSFPALTAITGSLNVNYTPTDCDVYIDGKKVGTTPDIFRNIGVGSHKVEIRKDGYIAASQTVTISENQTAEVSGNLTAEAAPVNNNNVANNNVVVSNASSGGSVQTFTLPGGVSFNMVRVAGGTFQMGADDGDGDEKPIHSVTLGDYLIGETEVTQGLWEAVMGTTVSQQRDKANKDWPLRGEGKDYPMYYVSWEECKEFIDKLNSLTHRQFRLPTEAEWEFAARGGNKSGKFKYSGSDNVDDVAWYGGNSGSKTHPVRTKKANELGIYDMSGNVWEWCEDRYGKEYYGSSPSSNPKGPANGSYRVIRGGSWLSDAWCCRVSDRYYNAPDNRNSYLGLRLAL